MMRMLIYGNDPSQECKLPAMTTRESDAGASMTSAPLWSYVTISLVVGYVSYRLGQVGNGHTLYVYFGRDWVTVLKIGLFGNMATPKYPGNQGANQGAYKLSYNYNYIIITYI